MIGRRRRETHMALSQILAPPVGQAIYPRSPQEPGTVGVGDRGLLSGWGCGQGGGP